jgi:hypothetical protein
MVLELELNNFYLLAKLKNQHLHYGKWKLSDILLQ